MKSKYALMAEMFKALGDENRLRLMEELKDGEKNAGELLDKLSVTQPTLSHHMKILCDSGIVESRKEGKWTYYSISAEGKAELLDIINSFNIARKKPSFNIEDIIVKAEEKPEEKKKPAKKPAKKKAEKKKEKTEEKIIIPEETVVESEEIEEATEEVKEELKEDTRRNMPSWLF